MRQPKEERRGNWYLLTGLLVGIAMGLVYAWIISPVQYIDTSPDSLADAYKDEYRRVVALAYQASGDIGRARERAALIDLDNPARSIAAQAQRMIAASQSPSEARALAILAADLGQQQSPAAVAGSPTPQQVADVTTAAEVGNNTEDPGAPPTPTLDQSIAIQTPTVPLPTVTPTITQTPLPTFTPRPTATPPEVQDAPFVLVNHPPTCDPAVPADTLQIQVNDAEGQPLPGVQVRVTWENGIDIFYTGLSPEINPGFADFRTEYDVIYALRIGQASEEIKPFKTDGTCGWRLEFKQSR